MITDVGIEEFLQFGSQKVPFWIYGDKKKQKIIFIHGFPVPFSDMEGDLPIHYLKRDYCVVCFDLPGFGVSKKLTVQPVTLLEKLKNKVAPKEKVVLYGVSYGGLVTLQYAQKNPEDIKAIIIAGTPSFRKVVLYGGRLASRLPSNIQLRLINILFSNRESLKKLAEAVFTQKASAVLSNFSFLDKKSLAQIKTPVLLLYSQKDSVAPIKSGKKLNEYLHESKLVITDSRTHGWLLHRIDESGFLEEIEQFLSNVYKNT